MIGVPRVFDHIYLGVTAKVNSSGLMKKLLFNFAYSWKLYYLNQGYTFDKVFACN